MENQILNDTQKNQSGVPEHLRISEHEALKVENIQLRLRMIQQDFELAKVRSEAAFAGGTQELNKSICELCARAGISPEEFDLNIRERRFVLKGEKGTGPQVGEGHHA